MRNLLVGLCLVVLLPMATRVAAAAPDTPAKRVLTLEQALAVVSSATNDARQKKAGGAIAVVDDGGHLLALERLDGTFPAAASVATAKARTAATFHKATADFEDAVNGGRTALVGVSEMTPLRGGVPLLLGGDVVGAVGVSGAASAQQDDEIARAAAGALR